MIDISGILRAFLAHKRLIVTAFAAATVIMYATAIGDVISGTNFG